MTFSSHLRLVCALFLWLAGPLKTASAGTILPIPVIDAKQLSLKVETPFNPLPPSGFAAVTATLHNRTGQRGVWNFAFSSVNGRGSTETANFSAAVEEGEERTFHFDVPLGWPLQSQRELSLVVSGPGLDSDSENSFQSADWRSSPLLRFLGVSQDLAPATNTWQTTRPANTWTYFRADELPEDWRALAGFDGLWLTEKNLHELSAPQRAALQDWLLRGGVLSLFETATRPVGVEEGLGRILLHPEHPEPGSLTDAADSPSDLPPPRAAWFSSPSYPSRWPAADNVGAVRPNVLLLTGLIVLLAAVSGPVNLYAICGGGRRSRMLWTTPIISLLASVLLMVLIFLQDGVGGWGERDALIFLLPGQSKAAVLQEQISRTGVLLSRGFRLENPALLGRISPQELSGDVRGEFRVQGNDFRGDWFGSRSRQGYWLETVIPTRGEVHLVSAGPEAPTIVSSIDATLEQLYLHAENGRWYQGQAVRTGEKRTLEPMAGPPLALLPEAGERLQDALRPLLTRPGCFFAVTERSADFQETLRSLRWKKQRAVYAGPLAP